MNFSVMFSVYDTVPLVEHDVYFVGDEIKYTILTY